MPHVANFGELGAGLAIRGAAHAAQAPARASGNRAVPPGRRPDGTSSGCGRGLRKILPRDRQLLVLQWIGANRMSGL